ncbi:MAG: hypothetical protein R6V77_04845 [Candidatus Cloacimonadaceae bacterium]
MFREKFILILVLTFVLETAALVAVLLLSQEGFRLWFWIIWLRSLIVAAGLDFSLVIYYGWDYLNPTETRLPVYLGLAASLLVGLIYKGISLLL